MGHSANCLLVSQAVQTACASSPANSGARISLDRCRASRLLVRNENRTHAHKASRIAIPAERIRIVAVSAIAEAKAQSFLPAGEVERSAWKISRSVNVLVKKY